MKEPKSFRAQGKTNITESTQIITLPIIVMFKSLAPQKEIDKKKTEATIKQ